MLCKHQTLLAHIRKAVAGDIFWSRVLASANRGRFALHLAIFREPYLSFVMEGRKTVETRFAKRRCPPFERVTKGDVVILKRAGGDVTGICLVERAWFYHIDAHSLVAIREKFGPAICAVDDSFWTDRNQAVVATILLITNVTPIRKVAIGKRDRRGWVVFESKK